MQWRNLWFFWHNHWKLIFMEMNTQAIGKLTEKNVKKHQRIRIILYTEDFDFAQSFSLYFSKDYHKIVTVNDRETFKQIVNSIQPEIIVIDCFISENLIKLINEIKMLNADSKIIIFTSSSISQQELVKQLQKMVSKIFYQPIDLVEFNQLLNFFTAD
jgi:DNA-binding response OmpR family regulator